VTGQEDVILRGLTASPTSLSWRPDGTTLAVSGFTDLAIHLWQPAPPPAHAVLTWQPFGPLALDRTGRYAAVVDRQAIHVRDNTGKVQAALAAGPLTARSPSPDGRWDAAAQGGNVLLKGTASNVLRGHTEVTALLWSADSHTLATADASGTIYLWHTATAEQRAVLRGHTDRVTMLAWSGDGRFLVSLSDDGTIRLWQVGPLAA
jgi:WD40 repeat protein